MELKDIFKEILVNDSATRAEVGDRIVLSHRKNEKTGNLIVEISRKQTPELFDDNLTLALLPTIFIKTETENPDEFGAFAQRDFIAVYLFNCSDDLKTHLLNLFTDFTGYGIASLAFVGSIPEMFSSELQSKISLLRFMASRIIREVN